MKKCPYCGEKIQETAKKCRYCGERLSDETPKGKIDKKTIIRRFIKVIYFIISILTLLIFIFLIQESTWISHGPKVTINNYFQIIINIILSILGYIIITDIFKRTFFYLAEGQFKGFINFNKILKKHIPIIIAFLIILIGLFIGSSKLKNECSGPNEKFDDYGVCGCEEGYLKTGNECKITIEKEIMNKLPEGSALREIKQLSNNKDIYIGIYVKNFEILKETQEKYYPYSDCFGEVEGQGIKGDYFLFSYQDGSITSEVEIPLGFRADYSIEKNLDLPKLVLPLKNTKLNNYNYYGGPKPINDNDNYTIETTNLINFKDYNGDGIKYEFHLIDHWDQVCGHNNYLIAGFNDTLNKIVIYGIKDKGGKILYWEDNFIPNEKGEVINGRECGDHGSETKMKNTFRFDSKENMYLLISSKETPCTEKELMGE